VARASAKRVTSYPSRLRAFAERIKARRGACIATVALAGKLVVLFWHLLTKEQDYAFGRPSLTRKKLRQLELAACAARGKGEPGVWAASTALREAELELARQAETPTAAGHRSQTLRYGCQAWLRRRRFGGGHQGSIGDDRKAVFLGDAGERLHVARRQRRRLRPTVSRRADLRKHSFHPDGGVHEQHSRQTVADVAEAMPSAPRHEDHAARLCSVHVLSNVEIEYAFEQDEGLIFGVVDVRRRPGVCGHKRFEQGEGAAGLCTGQQRRVRVS